MKSLILKQFPWPLLPTAALVIFFLFFVGLFIVTHYRSRTPIYKQASRLPLEDGIQSQELNDVR